MDTSRLRSQSHNLIGCFESSRSRYPPSERGLPAQETHCLQFRQLHRQEQRFEQDFERSSHWSETSPHDTATVIQNNSWASSGNGEKSAAHILNKEHNSVAASVASSVQHNYPYTHTIENLHDETPEYQNDVKITTSEEYHRVIHSSAVSHTVPSSSHISNSYVLPTPNNDHMTNGNFSISPSRTQPYAPYDDIPVYAPQETVTPMITNANISHDFSSFQEQESSETSLHDAKATMQEQNYAGFDLNQPSVSYLSSPMSVAALLPTRFTKSVRKFESKELEYQKQIWAESTTTDSTKAYPSVEYDDGYSDNIIPTQFSTANSQAQLIPSNSSPIPRLVVYQRYPLGLMTGYTYPAKTTAHMLVRENFAPRKELSRSRGNVNALCNNDQLQSIASNNDDYNESADMTKSFPYSVVDRTISYGRLSNAISHCSDQQFLQQKNRQEPRLSGNHQKPKPDGISALTPLTDQSEKLTDSLATSILQIPHSKESSMNYELLSTTASSQCKRSDVTLTTMITPPIQHSLINTTSEPMYLYSQNSPDDINNSYPRIHDRSPQESRQHAFANFCIDRQETLRNLNPHMDRSDIKKLLEKEWEELPEYRKKYYVEHTIPVSFFENNPETSFAYEVADIAANPKASDVFNPSQEQSFQQIDVQYHGVLPSLHQSLYEQVENRELASNQPLRCSGEDFKSTFATNSQSSVGENRRNAPESEFSNCSNNDPSNRNDSATSIADWNISDIQAVADIPGTLPFGKLRPNGVFSLPAIEPDISFEANAPSTDPITSRGRLLLNATDHSATGKDVSPPESVDESDKFQTPKSHPTVRCSEKPERLKRPPNAFLLYNRDMRHKLLDKNPSLNVAEISKTISKQWRNLTEEERAPYQEEAAGLKQKHLDDHPNFVYSRRSKAELQAAGHRSRVSKKRKNCEDGSQSPDSIKEQEEKIRDPRGRKKKRLKNPTAPKHPMSGFLFFSNSIRSGIASQNPHLSMGAVSKIIADRWKAMVDEARAPWLNKANEDKARYKRELQVYSASMISEKLKKEIDK
ncbi:hypothetical protein EC973_008355 [Apophysomyces ossiformis]|uniref:HMG box domain-containing protein n=1 Tax=Apophysomyces ossiformis TaxID=679940 RepID=A0A8H7BNP3_9FUNG|nr:hypothetical protein EC973_008355 [Apophysomyces ossiformis]